MLSWRRRMKSLYQLMMASPRLAGWNKLMFKASLWGMGVLNFEDPQVTGEVHLVKRLLPKLLSAEHPVLFDVGAHAGTFTQMLVAQFPHARILAFEPGPILARRLEAMRLPGVTVHSVALGPSEGVTTLFDRCDEEASQHASVYREVITDIHGQEAKSLTVKQTTVDVVARENGIDHIDFMKLDVEGAELGVLKGATGMIARGSIGCIQFEFNEMNVVSRCFLRDFRLLLPGFSLFRLLPRGLLPLEHDPILTELFAFQNVIALPDGLALQF